MPVTFMILVKKNLIWLPKLETWVLDQLLRWNLGIRAPLGFSLWNFFKNRYHTQVIIIPSHTRFFYVSYQSTSITNILH